VSSNNYIQITLQKCNNVIPLLFEAVGKKNNKTHVGCFFFSALVQLLCNYLTKEKLCVKYKH